MKHQLLLDKFSKIKLLLLDVDGVLTDGSIIYDDAGSQIKVFDVKDGLGIRLLMLTGVQVGIATGRRSKALLHRCENLGISLILDGLSTKTDALNVIYQQTGILADEIAFVGDDLMDLPLMEKSGVSVAVADAHELIRSRADMVTRAPGGKGAVREICEMVLKAKNQWDNVINRFM
ncbi:MAG: HAD hydrolase family protein [Deltaproteobacteria bacterium]|nr:HAD hydrolase family protein [Deltaproteobacteria bacterium]